MTDTQPYEDSSGRRDRSRPAARLSDQPRRVRTDRVHYNGLEERIGSDAEYERWRENGRRLRPARDAGIAVEGRVARERRRRKRARRDGAAITVAVLLIICTGVLAWRQSSLRQAAAEPLGKATSSQSQAQAEKAERIGLFRSTTPRPQPTPMFASHGSLQLRLPISVADLTEVGFHQAAYDYALPLSTTCSDAENKAAKRDQSTHRDKSKQASGADATLGGSVVRMWRDRPGKPDTAVDVGAVPGTTILAPVSGTIVLVKPYLLYGKYDDFRVHIRPDGHPKLDVVMIHIEGPMVKAGDRVEAGITKIGGVRKLSDKERLQLGDYTKDEGDHVHLQLNDATDPDYKGLEGAITVSGS